MVVLGTTIHEFVRNDRTLAHRNSWMVGSSPTMTKEWDQQMNLCRLTFDQA
jgi:hypothetical protein